MSDTKKKSTSQDIIALTQRQHLIKRMALTFGKESGDSEYPFSSQKSVAYREIIDNAIDILKKENEKGTIRVCFFENGSFEVQDSGMGIPVSKNKTADGKPASSLYLALGVMNAGSNYKNTTDSLGTNGLGGSAVVLLSEYVFVDVYRDGYIYSLHFKDGEVGYFKRDENSEFTKLDDLLYLKKVKDNRPDDEKKKFKTGTKIRLKLNETLFASKYPVDIDDLIERMRGVSFLCPDITIEIENQKRVFEDGSYQTELFNFTGGIKELAELTSVGNQITKINEIKETDYFIERNVQTLQDDGTLKAQDIKKEVSVNIAFTYANNYDYKVKSYVNTIKTRLGGSHEEAFEKAIVTAFNEKFRSMKQGLTKSDIDPNFQDYSEGLTAIISVSIPEPQFTSQIKEELGGKEAQKLMTKLMTKGFENWINSNANQNDLKTICDKVVLATRNRQKIKEMQDLKREKARIERSSKMPTKLVDCEITHSEFSELFIAEGDSALTGLKMARNSQYQALFPIRGKIMNVLKASQKEILKNQEIQDIAKCLDAGIGNDYKHANARYQKIMIAADADVDGAQISNLLLTVMYILFPDAINQGAVYKVLTPLFIIKTKKETHYCLNAEERDEVLAILDKKGIKYEITRAKGLAEAGADVLEYTGLNPQTRRIQRITVQDIEKAKNMLEIVMGEEVEPRRNWIEERRSTMDDNDYIDDEF